MIWFILVGIGMATGDLIMNYWADNNSQYRGVYLIAYVGALVVYCTSLTLYAYQFKNNLLSVAVVVPVLINVTIVSIASLIFLNERPSAYQIIGVCLAIVAVFFLMKE